MMTGLPEDYLDASAMREYFKPLEDWLTLDNAQHGEEVGWHSGKEATQMSCVNATLVHLFDAHVH